MRQVSSRRYFSLEKPNKGIFGVVVYAAFLLLMVMYSDAARQRERTRTIARLNDMDNCHDRPILPYHLTSRKISVIGKDLYVADANGTCNKRTQSLESFVVNITKCSDRTKSKCEHFNRMEWKGSAVLCSLLSSKITPWESAVGSFSPRLGCKNEKGPISVRNLTINFEKISSLNLRWSDYYVVQGAMFDETKSPLSCIAFEVDFPRIRG